MCQGKVFPPPPLELDVTTKVSKPFNFHQVHYVVGQIFDRGKFWWILTLQTFDGKFSTDGYCISPCTCKCCNGFKIFDGKFFWLSNWKPSKTSKFPSRQNISCVAQFVTNMNVWLHEIKGNCINNCCNSNLRHSTAGLLYHLTD